VNFKAQTKKVSAKAGPDAQKYRVFFENVQYTTTTPGPPHLLPHFSSPSFSHLSAG
jgi:hypothetical protein